MKSKRINRLINEGNNDPKDKIQLLGNDKSEDLKITSWDLVYLILEVFLILYIIYYVLYFSFCFFLHNNKI